MDFDIVGHIENVETIAAGASIRPLRLLQRRYGNGRWRKLKGTAAIRLPNGALRRIELHWYQAHGIGKRDIKVKRYLEQ